MFSTNTGISKLMKIRPVGTNTCHAKIRTGMRLIVAFRNYSIAPKKTNKQQKTKQPKNITWDLSIPQRGADDHSSETSFYVAGIIFPNILKKLIPLSWRLEGSVLLRPFDPAVERDIPPPKKKLDPKSTYVYDSVLRLCH
jgi:hypothetical protein